MFYSIILNLSFGARLLSSFLNIEKNAHFEGLEALHYRIGLKMFEDCYNRSIILDGDHVE